MDDVRRKEEGEDDGVDRQQQERIGQRPEKSEDRAAITRLQIARRERGDELAVAVERSEGIHVSGVYPASSRRMGPSGATGDPASSRRMDKRYESSVTISISVVPPIWNSDLSCSSTGSVTLLPSTSVPLVDFRSSRRTT